MKCLFLYNPQSGKGKINKYVKFAEKELKEKFEAVDVACSEGPKDMEKKAKEACGKYDYLEFSGGDGSFNEVINGICREDKKPVLGYIPTGTVNDISRSCGIPRRVRRAIKNVKDGVAKKLDVMCVNGACFAEYEISAGAMTSCSYKAPRQEKIALGKFAYALEILRHNMKLADFPVTVECGGTVYRTNCEFVVFINSRSIASMPVNPKAVLNDGEVELLLIRQVEKPRWYHKFRAFFKILHFFAFGYNGSKNSAHFIKLKGNSFTVKTSADTVWNFDGEEGVRGDISVKVIKECIELIVPERKAGTKRFERR